MQRLSLSFVSLVALAGSAGAQPAPDAQPPAQPAPPGNPSPAPGPGDAQAPAPGGAPAPEPAPSPPPAPAPAAEAHELPFKISGKTFVDASYARNEDNGANTISKTRGVDVKRFYLGVDYALNKIVTATFLTDIGDHNGRYDVFVKNAFFEAKLAPELVLRAGLSGNPWIPYAEGRYGFRYVENVLIDRTKYGNSADYGVSALGKLADGVVGYQVSIVNGNGFSNPARAKWPSVEGRLDATLVKHLYVAAGASVTTLGATTSLDRTATRYDGLVAWDDAQIRVGVEGFLAKDYTADQLSGKAAEDTERAVSAFASYRVLPMVSVFGRFDFLQPNSDTNSDIQNQYFNLGVQVSPFKFLDVALVYKHEQSDSAFISTSNGKIGTAVAGQSGTYQEVGLFSQVAF